MLKCLTSEKAGHLLSIVVLGDASPSGTHVGSHDGGRQELAAIVAVVLVHSQQALVVGEVPQETGLDVFGAVHLTNVEEGRQRVQLLPDGAVAKHVSNVAGTTGGRGAEERDALLLGVAGEAGVVVGNLAGENKEQKASRVFLWLCFRLQNVLVRARCTDVDGEAGFRALAGSVAVNAVVERDDDGRVRREGQVVVGELAEDGHQVSVDRVALHHFVGRPEDAVGHVPDLRNGQTIRGFFLVFGASKSVVFGVCLVGFFFLPKEGYAR